MGWMRVIAVVVLAAWSGVVVAGEPSGVIFVETPQLGAERVSVEVRSPTGRDVMLDLERVSVRAENFRARTTAGPGVLVEFQAPEVRTYRGVIRDDAGAVVAASITEHGISAMVLGGEAGSWAIEPVPESGPGAHRVGFFTDLGPVEDWCGVGPEHFAHAARVGVADDAASEAGGACLRRVRLAIDSDVEFFLMHGASTKASMEAIEAVVNVVNVIYARDLLLEHEITEIVIRTLEPDPYTSFVPGDVLNEFRNEWLGAQSDVPRDVAHFVTGKEMDGNIIGLAWVGVTCNFNWHYGLTQFKNLSFDGHVGVLAHELGHNWSAPHCLDPPCVEMCGACQVFGENTTDLIMSFGAGLSCPTPSGPFPTPVPPHARHDLVATVEGEPLTIDVLANDHDGNCEPVSLAGFDVVTPNGGTVKEVAEGVVEYTPAPGFAGLDTFSYVAVDDGGLVGTGPVEITVLELKDPVDPGFTAPGLDVAYYALEPGADLLPDFSTLTPASEGTVGNISFPSTGGVFADSGLADNVGAVFEGWLVAPATDTYTLFAESDDGSRVLIGDDVIVDNDGLHGMLEKSGPAALKAGAHPIRVEFFEAGGGAGLILRIEGGPLAKQTVGEDLLLRAVDCPPDFNGDGALNVLDFVAYQIAFGAGDLAADMNGDGLLNVLDFVIFQATFSVGCS